MAVLGLHHIESHRLQTATANPGLTTVSGPVDHFDENAKLVLALAQAEAFQFHHGYIGPEHLLLGLLRTDSVAARVLASSGVDLITARKAVERVSGRGDPQRVLIEIVLTPGAKKVIELASDEAKHLGAYKVAPEHVLLAIVREPGTAGTIFQGLEVSPDAIRQGILGT